MLALFTLLVYLLLLFFWSLKHPEVIIIAIAFFFPSLDILLDALGIYSGRLLTRLILVCWVLFIYVLKYGQHSVSLLPVFKGAFPVGYMLLMIIGLYGIMSQPYNVSERLLHIRNMFIYNMIPIGLFLVLYKRKDMHKRLPYLLAILSLMTGLIIYRFGDIENLVLGDRTTLQESIGYGSIPISRLAVSVFIISFFNIAEEKTLYKRAILILSLVLATYTILLSAQRGPIIGLAVSLLAWIIFKPGLKTRLKSLVAVVIVLVTILSLNLEVFGIVDRFADLRNYETFERYEDFPRSYKLFEEKPLFGHGIMGYYQNTGRVYPHNIFLEVMVDFGIVGIGILLFMLHEIIRWVLETYHLKRNEPYKVALATAWIALFVAVQFSGDLSGNHVFYSISGIICSIAYGDREQHRIRASKKRLAYYVNALPDKG